MKTLKPLLIVILVLLILPMLGYFGWLIKKGTPLEIVMINKSLIQYRESENKAFSYLLDAEKVLTSGNRRYNLKEDYLGFKWRKGDYRITYPHLKDIERTAEKADLVYFADASSLNCAELEKKLSEGEKIKPYGGLNNTDYALIRELISAEKPLIAECNFFGPPSEPLIRYNIEKLFDIYYVGWIGKYVKNLSAGSDNSDIIKWKELYEEYMDSTFSYSGPGLILVNYDAKQVVILEEGRHINTKKGLIVSGDSTVLRFGVGPKVNYCGWFTILHPGRNAVLSEFRLNANEAGKSILNEAGIPENFPALIETSANSYFLAGDFGKCHTNVFLPKVSVIRPLYDAIKSKNNRAGNFFYTYYQPFMTTLVEEQIERKQGLNYE